MRGVATTRRAGMVIAATLVAQGLASGAKEGKGKPSEPSLTGSAKMLRKDGQDVRFTFDARGLFPESKGVSGWATRVRATAGVPIPTTS
ncbi:hypothetical protein [Amycolatopsis orientalis]|uniref:hypothetical protein n=1 Tax=Amycolatopsis orientalis TaxID=31958 RepID=UPI000406B994|nr:hypothetical protein [Amycolatopsis orientalis]